MNIKELISVYMPTHNRADRVERAIESVLKQSYKNFELIVVDDGSIDETEKILKYYQDRYNNFSFYKLLTPKGACSARNIAIAKAKGKFIAGIDDDDEWHPDRLMKLFNAYKPVYSFIFAEDSIVRRDGNLIRLRKKHFVTLDNMLYQNEVGNQIFTETNRLRAIGGFDECLVAGQDYDTWLRLIKAFGDAKCVNYPLQIMHVDAQNRITQSTKKISGYIHFYKKHKALMNTSQRKFHCLMIYYLKNKKPSIHTALYLMGVYKFKRRVRVLLELFYKNNHSEY